MKVINAEAFDVLLKTAPIKPRFKRDLKFRSSTDHMTDDMLLDMELLPIWNKSGNGGIVLLQPADELYVLPFDATKSNVDTSGRSKPVICDLCFTWRSSRSGGFVTFYPDKSGDNSLSLLCCLDLRCSDNVRTRTPAALKSRAQLREDMTNESRVERLKQRLEAFIQRVRIEPVV